MFVKIMLATEKMKGPKSPSFLFHIINLVVSKPAGLVPPGNQLKMQIAAPCCRPTESEPLG